MAKRKSNLTEVKYPIPEELKSNTKEKCPHCGGEMRYGRIPCPEGRPGCLVIHYGYRCLSCGRIYQIKEDL